MNLIVGILYKLMSFCERLPNLCWDHSLNLSPWPCHPCPHPHLCRVFDVFGGVLAACCVHVIKESPTMWKSQGELLLRSYLNFDMDGHDQTTACFSRSPASGAYSKKIRQTIATWLPSPRSLLSRLEERLERLLLRFSRSWFLCALESKSNTSR